MHMMLGEGDTDNISYSWPYVFVASADHCLQVVVVHNSFFGMSVLCKFCGETCSNINTSTLPTPDDM